MLVGEDGCVPEPPDPRCAPVTVYSMSWTSLPQGGSAGARGARASVMAATTMARDCVAMAAGVHPPLARSPLKHAKESRSRPWCRHTTRRRHARVVNPGGHWRGRTVRGDLNHGAAVDARASALQLLVRVSGLLPSSAPAVVSLFTLLIGDARFKQGLALCAALCCPLIAAQHATRLAGPSGVADTASVFDLTVQYLNRENTVAALVEECGFLRSVFGGRDAVVQATSTPLRRTTPGTAMAAVTARRRRRR